MKNIGQMLKQAQQMQQKIADLQEKMGEMEITGQAANGLVEIRLSGKGEARSVRIDPSLVSEGEAEMLEDLVRTAINDANTKLDAEKKELMADLTGGLPLPPGLQLPF